jgi:ribosomal protein S18 acetylase RimI-like enzyme
MQITELREAQLEDAADVLAHAFFDYPAWTWLAPDDAQRRELMSWFMRMSLRYGLLSGHTYVAGDPIAGVAMWEPPLSLDATPDDPDIDAQTGWNELPQRMGADGTARLNAMIETQRPIRDRLSGGAPAWYLPWLGVEPSSQRSGVGKALLYDMFARIDAAGTPCMLETEKEANVPYYERHGFVVAESGTLPLSGPPFWTMWRDPSRG